MIAVSSSGKSFRALAAYLAAGRSGQERDRVAWTVGRNLPTNDPEVAAKIMRASADSTTGVPFSARRPRRPGATTTLPIPTRPLRTITRPCRSSE